MKKNKFYLITISILLALITACGVSKNMKILPEEAAKFTIKNDTIFYDSEHVANVESLEWEYLPGDKEMRMEISIKQKNPYDDKMTSKLIKYVHSRYPKAKIEVNFDD